MKRIHSLLAVAAGLLLVVLVGFVVWSRGEMGVQGVLWQNPADCLPLQKDCATSRTVGVRYGAYDPKNELDADSDIVVDHIFLSWADNNTELLDKAIQHAQSLKRTLFVSLEPWPAMGADKGTLLSDVAAGKYDPQTKEFCGQLQQANMETWVSWGHEMDHDLTDRYPWSHKSPAEFIAAYKHFVTQCKLVAPNVHYIWSSVGNKDLAQYWPGAEVVDLVGVPVYSYPEFDKKVYGSDRTFAQAFGEKYERVKQYNKPVVIVELGVMGDAQYQQYWLDEARAKYNAYPLLSAVVLFNASDTPGAWGADYATPDWRLRTGVTLK